MLSALTLALALAAAPPMQPLVHDEASLPFALVPLKAPVPGAEVKKAFTAFTKQPGCAVELRAVKRADYPGLADESLQYTANQLDAASLAALEKAGDVVSVEPRWPAKDAKRLREVYDVMLSLAKKYDAVVFDRNAASAYTADAYRARKVDAGWAGAVPIGPKHFMVHLVLQDDGTVMLDTGGLERFGLNDLTLLGVGRSSISPAGSLVNAVAQRLIEGARPDLKGRLLVKLDDLKEPGLKKSLAASCYPNAKRALVVAFGPPDVAAGARPEAIELSFPELKCANRGECLGAALTTLFGSHDQASVVQHDEAVNAARARALKDLAKYEAKLKKGLPHDEVLLVKAGFPFEGGTEWMWVEVLRWNGAVLEGRLESDPERVALRAGASVRVKLEDVMDYEYKLKDGTFLGNETGRVLHPEAFESAGGGRWRYKGP